MPWTLTFGVTTKSLAAWGIANAHVLAEASGASSFAFDLPTLAADADSPWANGDEITLKRPDGAIFFIGRRVQNLRTCEPEIEGLSYKFSGHWWYLEHLEFEQTVKTWNGVALVDLPLSHVWLGQKIDLSKQTTGEQMIEIMDWARAASLAEYGSYKFQLGTGDIPSVDAPVDEVESRMCSECIEKMRRWAPDSVLWWDYTTTPPTLNMKRRADLEVATVAMGNGIDLDSLKIASRDDLLVAGVHFKYRQSSSFDGVSRIQTFEDKAPADLTGRKFNLLVGTWDFDGGTVTRQRSTIETAPIDATSLDWWKDHWPQLNNESMTELEIIADTDEIDPDDDDNNLELINGTVEEWMNGEVVVKTVKASCLVTYVLDGVTRKVEVIELSQRCRCTSLESGTYSSTQIESVAESIPIGLAQQMYDALNVVHYDGQVTLLEEEVTGQLAVGLVLNLTGGRAEWATMNALIQSAHYDIDAGKTTVTLGPPQALNAGELIELLRVSRFRTVNNYNVRASSQNSGGDISAGQNVPRDNSSGNSGAIAYHAILDPEDPTIGHIIDGAEGKILSQVGAIQINHDASVGTTSLLNGGSQILLEVARASGKVIRLREVPICVAGVQKYMLVLCSVPYDAALVPSLPT